MIEALLYLALVAVVLVAGLRVGMLVAPRLTRWSERDDEEPHDD
jgi:hypothetical protein